jgi:broad specificity phosphatase PhoE
MPLVHFITHPEVVIDPAVPVTEWGLSALGRQRMLAVLDRPWLSGVGALFSSAERKAIDAAGLIADRLGLTATVIAELGENDRSATGYLAKSEFEATADEFFAAPHRSVRGWERAVDAQARIAAAVDQALARVPPDVAVAIVSHGAVGALLLCRLKRVPISRTEDQPGAGGGNVFSFDRAGRRLTAGWRRLEEVT